MFRCLKLGFQQEVIFTNVYNKIIQVLRFHSQLEAVILVHYAFSYNDLMANESIQSIDPFQLVFTLISEGSANYGCKWILCLACF